MGHETILIIDDEDVIRKLASLALRTHGRRVVAAENGSRGSLGRTGDIRGDSRFDDASDERGGGAASDQGDAAQSADHHFERFQIARRFESWGVTGVLSKPYTVAAIVSKVANVLRNRQV